MSDTLSNQTAVVTGGASGLGRAIARRFAGEGAAVTVADVRERPRLGGPPTHELIRSNGGDATFVRTDVAEPPDVADAVAAAVDEYGSLDVMVNNAGYRRRSPIEDVTESEYDKHVDVNLKGTYFGCKHAIAAMRDQDDGGRVVNVASTSGLFGFADQSAYCAAKAGVANLTRELAVEHGPEVRVNAICPGAHETAMTLEDEDVAGDLVDHIPLRRDGQPEDVADAALFLASDQSAYVTGHNLVVDGGLTASGLPVNADGDQSN